MIGVILIGVNWMVDIVDDSKGLQKKLVVNTQKQTREEKEKKRKKEKNGWNFDSQAHSNLK